MKKINKTEIKYEQKKSTTQKSNMNKRHQQHRNQI